MFYSSLSYIKLGEAVMSTLLLRFFMPSVVSDKESSIHFSAYIFVYYGLCICSWLSVLNVWIVESDITLWAESLFSMTTFLLYLLTATVALLPLDRASELIQCADNVQYDNNVQCSVMALLTALLYLVHAVIATDMVSISEQADINE